MIVFSLMNLLLHKSFRIDDYPFEININLLLAIITGTFYTLVEFTIGVF